jgi:modulator of FtsH protease HflK
MTEYNKAPDITSERLYLDTMESVYSKSQKVMVDVKNGGSNVLYLPLDRMSRRGNPTQLDLDSFNYPSSTSTTTSSSNKSSSSDDARSRGGR